MVMGKRQKGHIPEEEAPAGISPATAFISDPAGDSSEMAEAPLRSHEERYRAFIEKLDVQKDKSATWYRFGFSSVREKITKCPQGILCGLFAWASSTLISSRTRVLENVIRNAHDPILIFKPDRKARDITIRFVNKAFTDQTGYTEEEILGKTPEHLHGPETDRDEVRRRQETLSRGEAYVGELLLYKKNREPYWVDVSIVPMKNKSGKIDTFAAFGRDVTFRKKAEQIHEQFLTQLRRANEHNEKITKELQQSLARAEEANKAKSDFLANMSHEIRTPMNGVLGMAHLLSDTPMNEEQRGYVSAITGSAESLRALLNDILDLSRIEAGALALDNTPFVIAGLTEEVVNLLRPLASKKGIELFSNVASNVPLAIWGDPARLRQVLINLIGNAVKFTEQGYVRLSVEIEEGNFVSFKVEDTGIGIPADKIQAIFDKFTQADTSVTRRYGGTGLGLAITRQLVSMMGGDIGVDSAEGKGSTFWFLLPIKIATPDDLSAADFAAGNKGQSAQHRISVKDAKVLIVEDTPINQIFARKLLIKFGFSNIALAENGVEALSMTKDNSYDIILMDCQMPELDGYQATAQMRERESIGGGRHMPIVAMTANAMIGDREKCLEAGMDDYVSKPLHPQHLKAVLDRWIVFSSEGEGHTEGALTAEGFDKLPPVDLSQLRLFTDGDLEEERELAHIFSAQAHESVINLGHAITAEENETWRRAAHRLKGASGNLGAQTLSALCKNAERSLDKPADQKRSIRDAIIMELQAVEAYLMKELDLPTLAPPEKER